MSSKPVIIAVMGVTGTGKSSFIQTLTGAQTGVGESLHSETSEVEAYPMTMDGRAVELLDTPGFDDTSKSDTDTLQSILTWLKISGKTDTLLSGIIYLHRITDDRMTGSMMTNLKIVKELCGEQATKNIILVSTRWENARSAEEKSKFEARERDELKKNYWKLLINLGAKTATYNRTKRSGESIIRKVLRENAPVKIQVQSELDSPNASIANTGAGRVVMDKAKASSGRWEDQIQVLHDIVENLLQQSLQHVAQEHQESLERLQASYERETQNRDRLWESHTKVLEDRIHSLEDRIAKSERSCVLM